jgi:hypothetical protein
MAVIEAKMPHEDKVRELKALRARKRSSNRRAVNRPNKADMKLARDMGIRLV